MPIVILLGLSIMFSYFGLEPWIILFPWDKKYAQIAKEWSARMDVIVTVTGIVTGEKLSSNKITRETCLHTAKVKMAGYKNMYECIQCHKFIPHNQDSLEK